MLEALGTDTCFIMPEHISRTDPGKPITAYIGSGPFRFLPRDWVPGAQAAYARWDKYVPIAGAPDFTSGGKLANFDRVEWIAMPDPASAAAALEQGAVDWVQLPLIDLLPVLRASAGVQVAVNDSIGVMPVLAFNHLHPPFDNPKLLRALLPVVDQSAFVEAAIGSEAGLIHVPAGVFTPGQTMASDAGLEVFTDPRDPVLARRLVAESGYNGEKVVLMSPSDYPAIQALCQVARDLFEQAGLTVDYASMDWRALEQRRASRAPPAAGGWSSFCTTFEGLSLASPAGHLPLRGNGVDGWFGWPTSPRIEALRKAWFAAPDLAAQRDLCAQMQSSGVGGGALHSAWPVVQPDGDAGRSGRCGEGAVPDLLGGAEGVSEEARPGQSPGLASLHDRTANQREFIHNPRRMAHKPVRRGCPR